MPLVPLIGQSRKVSPRVAVSRARRSVRAGEIVLIWRIVWPGRAPAVMPSGPRIACSTIGREGSSVATASAARATSAADRAAVPPSATSRSTHAGTTSYPTTARPASRSRCATAPPRSPSPTIPTVVTRAPEGRPGFPGASRASAGGVRGGRSPPRSKTPGAMSGPPSLAVLAGRVVAVVDRLLEELLCRVRPELRDGRKGVHDRVLQPAAHALHLAHVDVHDRVAVVVEAHG